MFTSREDEPDEGKGATIGGESLFGRLAFLRTKLHLSDSEIMNKSWIALQLESYDYPYFDAKAKNVIKGKQANAILEKYIK